MTLRLLEPAFNPPESFVRKLHGAFVGSVGPKEIESALGNFASKLLILNQVLEDKPNSRRGNARQPIHEVRLDTEGRSPLHTSLFELRVIENALTDKPPQEISRSLDEVVLVLAHFKYVPDELL
jgi:hypothetical protein